MRQIQIPKQPPLYLSVLRRKADQFVDNNGLIVKHQRKDDGEIKKDKAAQYQTCPNIYKLLRDLDLPHALLDENGKIIWTNIAFEKAVDKEKGYRKSITSLFPSITAISKKPKYKEDCK